MAAVLHYSPPQSEGIPKLYIRICMKQEANFELLSEPPHASPTPLPLEYVQLLISVATVCHGSDFAKMRVLRGYTFS